MTTEEKIVVVGGGAIGLSVAYHLGKLGLENVVLVERDQLTSGTSWHAAGIVGPLRSSKNLTELAQYGIGLFERLEDETGLATGYRQTGGLWLAQTNDRLTELKRIAAMGQMHQLDTAFLSPEQIQEKLPLLSIDGLIAGLWVDQDGQINPVDLCMAYAKGARQRGVEIREHCYVEEFILQGDSITEVQLSDNSSIKVGAVVNCAGLWAREVGAMVGVDVPLRAVEHIYLVSETIDTLPDPCPILRDMDSAIYLKGDAGRLVLGTFEANPRLWHEKGFKEDAGFIEFPEDWDHIEPMMQAGIRRVPSLAQHGVTRVMNGPESFTPDTRQIMGRAGKLNNFYVAAGFNSIGIMSSAGVGKVMADWIYKECPPMDLWEVDVQRFTPEDNQAQFLDNRIPEAVHNQFAMHWPYKQFQTGRNQKQSVWHDLMAQPGAVFGAPTGWERPLWFARDNSEREIRYSYGAQVWWPYAEREAQCLMEHGAVFELSPFSKHLVSGPDVVRSLQRLCSREIDIKSGRLAYVLMLNVLGGIEMECTVTRMKEDQFLIVSSAATRQRDGCWLRAQLPDSCAIQDLTEEYSVLGVMGPRSADLLGSLGVSDLGLDEFPLYTMREVHIAGLPIQASRLSYVGEKGWELMISSHDARDVFAAVAKQMPEYNMVFAGHYCLDSCRLEKGYAHWGHDIGSEDTPIAAGLGFAVNQSGNLGFIGEPAITQLALNNPRQQRVLFEVHADKPLLLHDEPIYLDREIVGRTTSGGRGFRTGTALSMAMIDVENAYEKTGYEIDVAGERFSVSPLRQPPYDPAGLKLRMA